MKVSKEELLHIANLANLNLNENEIDEYLKDLDQILSFTDTINSAPIDDLKESITSNENSNVFRKDEIEIFDNQEGLLENAPETELNMFKIPKVI